MNAEKTVYDRVKDLLVKEIVIPEEEITRDADLIQDLGLDSLDMVELTMACEEEFGIEIDDLEASDEFIRVKDVVKFIEERMAKSA